MMAQSLTTNFKFFRRVTSLAAQQTAQLHQLAAKLTSNHTQLSTAPAPGAPVLDCASSASPALVGGGWSLFSVRHKIRNYFPKPREHKRLQFTWEKRIQTPGGRAILMRRILKGRHVIAHPVSMLPHWPHKQY
ncbi:39S ribosomal protein L34, mitochondrial [Frankliniella fusca]|uniref:39S ribosomal protein L34, mitochondrial n=1 Tax=Frankliniella fusca TaxID=407009 RepID=A0AAE1HPQ6_9NEOP|nr:39S ribosomal protein L34, mitochondrial [Frankliniella fusca]